MILTLCNQNQTLHIDITADQFERLRHPDVGSDEIASIAEACNIDSAVLIEYVSDLKKAAKEVFEIDASCDYTDHL